MKTITKKELLTAQQGEIDAVILYKKVANRIGNSNPEIYKTLQSISSDEGKHANMLRKLTGEVCRPKNTTVNLVLMLTYIIGKKNTLKILAKAEHGALDTYKPFVAQYPELEPMRLDEGRHGDLLLSIANQL